MTIYDLTIESAEINLLVTEGFIDKGKKVLEDLLKKSKNLFESLSNSLRKFSIINLKQSRI